MEMAAVAPVHANDYKYNITLNSSPNSLKSIFLWFFSTSLHTMGIPLPSLSIKSAVISLPLKCAKEIPALYRYRCGLMPKITNPAMVTLPSLSRISVFFRREVFSASDSWVKSISYRLK